jgi:hypothetical protein
MQKYSELEVWIHAFLNSALDWGVWLASRPSRFAPELRTAVSTEQEAGRCVVVKTALLWGPPILLSDEYRALSSVVKRPRR